MNVLDYNKFPQNNLHSFSSSHTLKNGGKKKSITIKRSKNYESNVLSRSKFTKIANNENLSDWLNTINNGTYLIVKHKDIFAFFESLIITPLLKEQIQNPQSLINHMLTKFYKKGIDLILYKCINYEIEQFHHTSWWGVLKITERDPIIIDLYYLHEMTHISNIYSNSTKNFEDWCKKMLYEEIYASAFSEIIIYFDIPTFRNYSKKTKKLKGTIFADSLLSNEIKLSDKYKTNQELYKNNFSLFTKELIKINVKTLYTPPLTTGQRYVFSFRLNNEMWFEIWKNSYEIIEKENISYLKKKNSNQHINWLKNNGKLFVDNIPFSSEAHIFYEYLNSRIKSSVEIIPFSSAKNKKTQDFIDLLTYKYGIMKSVILSPIPEVLDAIKQFKKTDEGSLLQQETYTYWQDYYGEELIKLTRRYIFNIAKSINDFTNGYIFLGSNEAHYKLFMLMKRDKSDLHVMESEYEGYRFVAKNFGIKVIFHKRDTIEKTLKEIKAGDNFWLSNPNSMDGNIIKNFDKLMKICEERKAKVYIDMVYIGTIAKKFTINLNYECIYAVSWSGSKAFPGLFYYRIGILFTREKFTEFLGTRWFHNMESIRIGLDFLTRYGPFDIPQKYIKYQEKACTEISKVLNYKFKQSDCVWLLWAHKPKNKRKDLDYFYRPNSEILRITVSEYIKRNATHYLQKKYEEFVNYNVNNIIDTF